MRRKNQGRGFTLIELLIVIAIIGTLASLLLANFAGVRGRARDARRKSDFDAIKTALRLYYNDYQRYPGASSGRIAGCGAGGTTACAWGSGFSAAGTQYMGQIPTDPVNNSPYVYAYSQPGGDTDQFCLTTELEGTADEAIAESQARCSACGPFGGNPVYAVCAD